MKQIEQSKNSGASLCLKKDSANQVPKEVYEIVRLMANIIVDKHLTEINKSTQKEKPL